jgi:hypothetical protein
LQNEGIQVEKVADYRTEMGVGEKKWARSTGMAYQNRQQNFGHLN